MITLCKVQFIGKSILQLVDQKIIQIQHVKWKARVYCASNVEENVAAEQSCLHSGSEQEEQCRICPLHQLPGQSLHEENS